MEDGMCARIWLFLKMRKPELLLAASIGTVTFGVYVSALCPTVNFIDSGELSAVSYTLGVAHPTGYPLFTLLGWLFSHAPLDIRPIVKLNFMSAVFSSLGVAVFFRLLVSLLTGLFPSSNPKRDSRPNVSIYFSAACGALVLGFSATYWSQGLSIEVYSLHGFFLTLLLYLFYQLMHQESWDTKGGTTPEKERMWIFFAFVLGLAFTNHMTTILLAPGFLIAYGVRYRLSSSSLRRLAILSISFLLGLSAYLYLPIVSSSNPILNWGDPQSLEKFEWHFSGKQYRVWLFASGESAQKQLSYFISRLPIEFAYLPLAPAAVGLVSLFRRQRETAFVSGILFATCVLYSINYDIHDIDSYFLLAFIVFALWAAVGMAEIVIRFGGSTRGRALWLFVGALSLAPLAVNYTMVDESGNTHVERYTRNLFDSLKPNALILSYQWDYFVSPAYYLQLVEGIRPDVVVIDKELLRRSWYFSQMAKNFPRIYERSKAEIEAFLPELRKFETGVPYRPEVIEYRYAQVLHSLVSQNIDHRPVYVTPEIESEYIRGFQKVPDGLAFRLYADSLKHSPEVPASNVGAVDRSDKYRDGIRMMYTQAFTNHALYQLYSGNRDVAMSLAKKALLIRPGDPAALALKDKLETEGVPPSVR